MIWGKVDIRELKKLQKNLDTFQKKGNMDAFCSALAKEIAARLLTKVTKKTPVGKYPKKSGKVGGTLRRGWTIGEIQKSGTIYIVEVVNPVYYASYVELGHRTPSGRGWVKGRFMLKLSEEKIQGIAPKLIEKRVNEKLREVFSGK